MWEHSGTFSSLRIPRYHAEKGPEYCEYGVSDGEAGEMDFVSAVNTV